MNYRQTLFVAEYMVDGHAGPAAIRAGYSAMSSDKQGCELLKNPEVAEAIAGRTAEKVARIDEKMAEAEARLADEGRVTVPWVRGLIYDTATRCADPEAYMPAQVLRAAELAGKHLSMFVDRVDVQASVTFNINLAGADGRWNGDEIDVIDGQVIEVEEVKSDGDQGVGDGGPVGQLGSGAGGGGQAASLGEGEGSPDRGGPDDTESPPGAR